MGTSGLDCSQFSITSAQQNKRTKRNFDIAFLTGTAEGNDVKRPMMSPSSDSNSSPEPKEMPQFPTRSAFTKVNRDDLKFGLNQHPTTSPYWNIPLLTTAQQQSFKPNQFPEINTYQNHDAEMSRLPSPGQLSPPFSLYFYDWLTQIQARSGDGSQMLPLANPYLNIPDLGKNYRPEIQHGKNKKSVPNVLNQSAAFGHALPPSYGSSKTSPTGFPSSTAFINPMTNSTSAAALSLPTSIPFSLTLPAQNTCACCSLTFRMTSDLVYHMRTHHKRQQDPERFRRAEKLKCPICKERFRERHHLTRHMTAHEDKGEEVGQTETIVTKTAE
jgi:hypothetical protein